MDDYLDALRELRGGHPDTSIDDLVRRHSSNVRWDREMKNNLRRKKEIVYSEDNVWTTQYRPFVKQHCYVEYVLANNKYQQDSIFPAADSDNRAICVPGVSSTAPFSVLMVDAMPDLHLVAYGQCFPRYRYQQPPADRVNSLDPRKAEANRQHHRHGPASVPDPLRRQHHYQGRHLRLRLRRAECARLPERFANDLTKELPRIPFAPFHTFAKAGRELAAFHLGYEHCDEHALKLWFAQPGEPKLEHFGLGTRAMRFADDEKTELIVNDHLRLRNIPAAAHRYHVNGRTPLEWFIDRYRIKQDKESGIVNDPTDGSTIRAI